MAKEIWRPGNMLYPLPAVMVSCKLPDERPNIITVASVTLEGHQNDVVINCPFCELGHPLDRVAAPRLFDEKVALKTGDIALCAAESCERFRRE